MENTAVDPNPTLLSLGDYYVSDFLDADASSTDRKKYSLDLVLDPDIRAVRLKKNEIAPSSDMWGKYWYRSGTNATMIKELSSIVDEILLASPYRMPIPVTSEKELMLQIVTSYQNQYMEYWH